MKIKLLLFTLAMLLVKIAMAQTNQSQNAAAMADNSGVYVTSALGQESQNYNGNMHDDSFFTWQDGAGGMATNNFWGYYGTWPESIVWPPSSWPQPLPAGSLWANLDNDDVITESWFPPSFGYANIAVSATNITGTSFTEHILQAMTLATGGSVGSTNSRLWVISVSATTAANPYPPDIDHTPWNPVYPLVPVLYDQIAVGIWGTPGTDGKIYKVLQDNQKYDASIRVIGNNFNTYQVLAAPDTLHILQGGSDVTGSNVTAIVGQLMNLTCQLQDTNGNVVTTPAITNFAWTVPGQAVKSYQQIIGLTNSSIIMENLNALDLASNSIAFYWINGGTNLELDCTVTILGQQVNAKTFFTINRPVGTLTTVTTTNVPAVNIITNSDDGSIFLQFGDNSETSGGAGIYFTFSVTTPTNGAGQFGYLQTVDSIHRWILDDSTAMKGTATNAVDVIPAYPPIIIRGQTSIGNSASATNSFSDSPGDFLVYGALPARKWVNINDSFHGYLLYRPNGDTNNTIWITLCKLEWSYSGSATKGTNGLWSLDSGYTLPPVNPSGVDTDELPTWNRYVFPLTVGPDN
jgi:hypothetical protein